MAKATPPLAPAARAQRILMCEGKEAWVTQATAVMRVKPLACARAVTRKESALLEAIPPRKSAHPQHRTVVKLKAAARLGEFKAYCTLGSLGQCLWLSGRGLGRPILSC